MVIRGNDLKTCIRWFGRTLYRQEESAMFFDWTCSGFVFRFRGKTCEAVIRAYPGVSERVVPGNDPFNTKTVAEDDWPVLAVFADDAETPCRIIQPEAPVERVLLFASEGGEEHEIKVIKISENQFGQTGLVSLEAEQIEPSLFGEKDQIEFVGDSITCGYGNLTYDYHAPYCNRDENGWLAYGAVCSRILDFEPSFISYSGITVSSDAAPFWYGMLDLYDYTDRILEERLLDYPVHMLHPGVEFIPGTQAERESRRFKPIGDAAGEEHTRWDFAAHPKKYVVINLGTNDSYGVYYGFGGYTEKAYEADYQKLIGKVRKNNGPDTFIICAMGSMDYFLYDNLLRAVADYKAETGDERICTFKFKKMMPEGTDVGAAGHPSKWKQEAMGKELAAFIKQLEL